MADSHYTPYPATIRGRIFYKLFVAGKAIEIFMKKFVTVFILLVIVFTMSACSQKADNEATDGTSITTTMASTTKAETTETTAKEETKPNAENMPATSKPSTTQKQTTTKKSTSTQASKPKETTTQQKQTTTKKQETTTQKPTTTKHDHIEINGNMGKWFNSRAELNDYYHNVVSYWNNKDENGEITRQEYYKNCPYGYESWSCPVCHKWTGNFYYR